MKLEEFEETKALVISIMNENKIDYNKGFLRMGSAGYPNDACQALAEDCLEIMAEYCRNGVNAGFNRSMEDSLEALSDICAQMSDRRKDRDADKRREACEKKKADIMRDVKLTKAEEVGIKDLVFMYIDSALQAVPALERKNPKQKDVLMSSEKKLVQLRTSIEKAVDDSSKDAEAFANEIIKHLQSWRDEAASSTLTTSSLSALDDAVDVSHKWGALFKPVKNSARADASKFTYFADEIDRIAKCSELKERMDNLRARIDTARGQLDIRYDTATLESRRESVRSSITKLEAEKESAIESYENGEISDDELIDMSEDLDDRIEDLKTDAADLSSDINTKKNDRRNQEMTFDEVEKICNEIDSYETEPVIYSALADTVSFESVDAIISGVATAQQRQDFVDALRTQLRIAKETREGGGKILVNIRGIKDIEREERRKLKEQERAERAKAKGETPEDAERIKQEKLAKILGRRTAAQPNPADPVGVAVTRRKNDDLI